MNRVVFPALIWLAVNQATGETFYLPSEAEVMERDEVERADFVGSLEMRYPGDKKAQDRDLQLFDTAQQIARARLLADIATAKPTATRYEFTLVRPTAGIYERATSEANEPDMASGQYRWNEAKFRRMLLDEEGVKDKGGKTLSAAEISDLDPTIFEILGARLSRSVKPDTRRLVFTSRASVPT